MFVCTQGQVCSSEEVCGEDYWQGARCEVPAEKAEGSGLPQRHSERDRGAGVSRGKSLCGGTARGLRDHLRDHPRIRVVRHALTQLCSYMP